MDVRVITLRYRDGLHGFSEDELKRAKSGRDVLDVREYFFIHGNVPHLAVVLQLGDGRVEPAPKRRSENDPGTTLPEHLQPLYRELRHWRNERAKEAGVPSYVIMRNIQIAEICRQLPRSLAALKEIEGIGEATCAKYGKGILDLIPPDLVAAPPAEAERESKNEGDQ